MGTAQICHPHPSGRTESGWTLPAYRISSLGVMVNVKEQTLQAEDEEKDDNQGE